MPELLGHAVEFEGDGMVIRRLRGFTLIELLVVIAIIALLISILLPSLSRARELSKRLVCQSNMKGIGTSCKIYSNDNNEKWPVPPFDRSLPNRETQEAVDYCMDSGYTSEGTHYDGLVGHNRQFPSFSIAPNASTQVSVTRAFWLLVRAGSTTVKQYVCPSSTAEADDTQDLSIYYDFHEYGNISYGYQVPFGPRDTRPREGMDNRQIVIADKGPFYIGSEAPMNWQTGKDGDVTLEDSPKAWRAFNSANHGGAGSGEGQQVLFADGHATFERTPTAGVDNDNIYTVITFEWGADNLNLIHGELPCEKDPPAWPGQMALGTDFGDYAGTDTLIYP
jgi:prepilin-type N-terminal cleavage/methylation domain-containing protein